MKKKASSLVEFKEDKEFEVVEGKPKYKFRHSTNNEDGKNKDYSGLDMEIIKMTFKDMKELNENLELNLDRKTLSNYIHGKTVPPVDIVNKIAIACNTTMDTLVIRENKNIEKPKYSYTKAVYKLNKDYTYEPFIASKGGKRGYLTYNFRHYSDNASLEPFMLMFDCDIFKAGKGSILMVDRDKINWILRPNIDAFCLMRKIETKSKIITDQYGHKKQTTEVVETLYPTIVKRIRYNGHFDEVPIDMVTYVDFTGREVIISFKEFFENLFAGRITTIVREV